MAKEVRKKASAKEWAKTQTAGGFEPTAVRLPQGFEYWKPDVGVHIVDFMPYVAGKFNPRADEGYEFFERTYNVHRIVLPNGNTNPYCCLWDCFKEDCPVCAFIRDKGGAADQDLIKSLKNQTRHLWLVNENPGKTKTKLKVYDSNHYAKGVGFGEMMVDAINECEGGDSFADLENGMGVRLVVKEDSFPGKGGQIVKFNKVTKITLVERKSQYPASYIDEIAKQICLDDCLIKTSAKALEKLMSYGSTDSEDENQDDESPRRTAVVAKPSKPVKKEEPEDEEEDETPAKTNGKKKSPVASDFNLKVGTLVTYEGEECEIKKISGDGTSLTLESEDRDVYNAVAPEDVKKVKVKEDEEKPAPRIAGKVEAAKKKKPEPEDDEDEDLDLDEDDSELEEEDEAPAPKKKNKARVPADEDEDEDMDEDSELEDSDDESEDDD